METLFKMMLGNSLVERLARAIDDSKLFTEHEVQFICEEVGKIVDKKSGE